MNAPARVAIGVLWVAMLGQAASGVAVQAQAGSETAEEPGDPTERARVHFKLGVDFYHERNFRAALIEFKRAYQASPHYKLLYNLGQTSLELQEDGSAIEYYTRYLEEGGNELNEERQAEVRASIAKLRARLGSVTVTTNQAGAEIYVDETLIGTSPLKAAVKVTAGRRRFVAVKQGFADAERVIDVASGDLIAVDLEFKERPQLDLAKLQGVLQEKPRPEPSTSPALWTGLATGAVAAGAITLTILTVVAQRKYDDERKVETTRSKLQDLRDDANTKALVADILWGATVVGAGLTVAFLIADSDDSSEHAANQPKVALSVAPNRLGLTGTF